ncbi:MAG: diphosphomevalonate decarboxylase [Bdellovibrionota bacterium]
MKLVSKPSNIALIKYMGKIAPPPGMEEAFAAVKNLPTNSSFSWTLESLRTFVDLEQVGEPGEFPDQWQPLKAEFILPFEMSDKGRNRYLNFWNSLKEEFQIKGSFHLRSGNNFPSDCGLASSASSFAALTQSAYEEGRRQNPKLEKSTEELAELSRRGSGSSCRSFITPWCLWNAKGVEKVELPYKKLSHWAVVISDAKKEVSSSDAHKIVSTSLLFQNRPQRAEERLHQLLKSLQAGAWGDAYEHVWEEFMDMHELFHTSKPAFSYINRDASKALEKIKDIWKLKKDSPLVTMDAGPNIHLMFHEEQRKLEDVMMSDLQRDFKCIASKDFHV